MMRDTKDNPHNPHAPGTTATVLLAFYVAVSWTWVIGMFLPVVLVRDFGLLGWVAFAVPNVIGAAAVGFILRDTAASLRFTRSRVGTVAAFSAVTLVLQCFTVTWLVTRIAGGWAGAAVAAAAACLPVAARHVGPFLPPLAVGVWLVSATAGVVLWSLDATTLPTVGDAATWPLVGLAAVCVLGFLTCPLLDASLQDARQAAGSRGRVVFGVGFGVLFLTMIVLTLGYARVLPGLLITRFGVDTPAGVAALVIAGHLTVQVVFTNAAHVASLTRLAADAGRPGLRPGALWVAFCVAAGLLGWVLAVDVPLAGPTGETVTGGLFAREAFGYVWGEVAYRSLLVAYGLVFPAWLLVRGTVWRVGAVVAASPFLAVGFFGGMMGWAAAGVGVVVVAAAITRVRRAPPPPHAAR